MNIAYNGTMLFYKKGTLTYYVSVQVTTQGAAQEIDFKLVIRGLFIL